MKEIYKECPFYGVPRLTHELQRRGYQVNHKRVRRLQKAMGMRTIYPRPKFNTSVSAPENREYPYLLRCLEIESVEFMEVLIRKGIRISMDGRGRCLDNAKMERFLVGSQIRGHQTQGL